jgi:hypothetical protein
MFSLNILPTILSGFNGAVITYIWLALIKCYIVARPLEARANVRLRTIVKLIVWSWVGIVVFLPLGITLLVLSVAALIITGTVAWDWQRVLTYLFRLTYTVFVAAYVATIGLYLVTGVHRLHGDSV